MKKLIDQLYEENNLKDEDLLSLLDNLDKDHIPYLFSKAKLTKEKYYGDKIYMRGLIEFTNICKQDCLYCGIRKGNTNADRYRLTEEEIFECASTGYKLGYRTFVLQGGEDPYFTDEKMGSIIHNIKIHYPEVAITLSIGERSKESYKTLKSHGVDRFLLRHETASESLYNKLHPGMSFTNRLNSLLALQSLGYQVGAGFMVGLPHQTNEDLVKDLRFLKNLNPEMIGIGPFIAHSETPLGDFKSGTLENTLIMVAITRLMLPKVLLPSTTALGTLDNLGREKAIRAGANVVMPNLSPTDVREKYELYENKICTGDAAEHCRHCIEARINTTESTVDMSIGHHYDWR